MAHRTTPRIAAVVATGTGGDMPTPVDTGQVRGLIQRGARLADALPAETFLQEHLPAGREPPTAHVDLQLTVCEAQP
jgi:hypothetical protein